MAKRDDDRKPGERFTPLRAVRRHCVGCCGGQAKEVALCPVTGCFLWPYRFGGRKRAEVIVAQEKAADLPEEYWAEALDDYTSQTYYRPEMVGAAR